MRIKHSIFLEIANDADMKEPLFGPIDETLAATQIDGYTKPASGIVKVLATQTESIPFGDVAAVKGIYLKVNQNCGLKINGEAAITLAMGNANGYARFFLEAALTSVQLVAGSADVQGIFCVWGDPAA
jgi:hypothetical protein